jgi:type II secretory ATPase GspE/PulE/Tfp pilus assembly ATPase PilB-like protein
MNQRLLRRICAECAGKGCAVCLNTGYRGRVPIVEWLRVDAAVKRKIAGHEIAALTAQPSLADVAQELVQSGVTGQSEVSRLLGG